MVITVQKNDKENKLETPLVTNCIDDNPDSYCWVLYQNWFGRWQIRECYLRAIVYTNLWSYKFDNGWCYTSDQLGKEIFLRNELAKAKEECIRRNKLRKVKVKEL